MLLLLSLLAGVRFDTGYKLYVAGEVADQDVSANQDLLIEDAESTARKRRQLAEAQPPVFDLDPGAASRMEQRVNSIFSRINDAPPGDLERVRWQVSEELDAEVRQQTFNIWRSSSFQSLVMGPVLPWIKDKLAAGVVADDTVLKPHSDGSILIRDTSSGQERLVNEVKSIPEMSGMRDSLETMLKSDLGRPLRIRNAVFALVGPLLKPSLTLNTRLTNTRKAEVMAAVEPVYTQIKQGEIIVRQGERVTPEQQVKLQALYAQRPEYFEPLVSTGAFIIGLMLVLGLYLGHLGFRGRLPLDRDAVFLATVLLLFGLLAKGLLAVQGPLADSFTAFPVRPEVFAYLLPVAGAGGVMALFLTYEMAFFSCLLVSFSCAMLAGGGLGLFVFYFITSLFYTFFIKRTRTRSEMLRSIFPLLGATVLAWGGVGLMEFRDMTWLAEGAVSAGGNVAISLLTVLSLGAVMELVFGYTSRFKLLELMNLEQPLLQELMVNAPGTYHHSLVVSNMVEAGARAIGADPILAKVSALYHDVGKLKNPHYFIENQFGQANRHDKLAPSMSALILISHVKKGVEMARKHGLGPEISDIVQQHHGTSLITCFYRKAQEKAEAKGEDGVRMEDYRYPGPKPQTKEAGLIMLADAIEASSRTLVDPTHSRIKGHIDTIIRTIFTEGQLDESELTLRDLHLASEAFQRVLTGMFHQRIEYPDQAKPEGEGKPESRMRHPSGQLDAQQQMQRSCQAGVDPSKLDGGLKVIK
ncbi:HD family phosphohydrolase [Desulfohalovibrio reitneri]|uniref:HD family phosphohydrolase n=1 Tax=Desulfohalovibrio reitneri TaxID=1307759 RepID=UPI000690A3A0|nr:HDIG domain-containing metalloprotein [Desulfohalovibrio reitneri]